MSIVSTYRLWVVYLTTFCIWSEISDVLHEVSVWHLQRDVASTAIYTNKAVTRLNETFISFCGCLCCLGMFCHMLARETILPNTDIHGLVSVLSISTTTFIISTTTFIINTLSPPTALLTAASPLPSSAPSSPPPSSPQAHLHHHHHYLHHPHHHHLIIIINFIVAVDCSRMSLQADP